MPGGRHQFEFEGKEPLAFRLVTALLFANTLFLMLIDFGAKYFLSKASLGLPACESLTRRGVQYHAPNIVCWYASCSIPMQWVLLAMMVAILIIFRKRVRNVGRT